MLWLLGIGGLFSLRIKNSADMFAAGSTSPWWISALSGYMTVFSAGTFVVWGGIAYRLGLVAVSVLAIIGLSIILIGFTAAPRWRKLGITTPSEFLRIRFNQPVVQAYTWVGVAYGGLAMGVGLYSLAVMLASVVPLPEGLPFRDDQTGNLSVSWSILLWGTIVIAYTMAGGLWAVLITDVIQCLVLSLLVLVMVPLSLSAIGGADRLWNEAPDGFFSPASGEYTYSFLLLWLLLSYFRYAADWPFVQRYICVPTPNDARKAALLIGGLYIFSPLLWMLPAMVYRIINPDADPEQAYVLMCGEVLPAGMLGIMLAAMFSATASMISSLLNVLAGVFTCDVYRPLVDPNASDHKLLIVGRLTTLFYGAMVVAVALLVPRFGGAEKVVLALVTSIMGPLMLPIVWGLYSRHINQWAVWSTLTICGVAVIGWRILLRCPTWLTNADLNVLIIDSLLGLVLPLIVLLVAEVVSRRYGVNTGWTRIDQWLTEDDTRKVAVPVASKLPSQIISASLGMLGITMALVAVTASAQRVVLSIFSLMLLAAAICTLWGSYRIKD